MVVLEFRELKMLQEVIKTNRKLAAIIFFILFKILEPLPRAID
jgi:hypothetical protein